MKNDELILLFKILSYKRKANSLTEKYFIYKFIDSLVPSFVDEYGNRGFFKGRDLSTLFCCHIDTVHKNPGRQGVAFNSTTKIMYLHDETDECLGADDGAGVWLLMNMMKRGVPGIYIFHRGEESWGEGSFFFCKKYKKMIEDIGVKRCLSFDYTGVSSVITHQFLDLNEYLYGGFPKRTCSDEFALALCKKLGMSHTLNANGIFTDSAAYSNIISECTNVSIGFYDSHSPQEYLHVKYLEELLQAVTNFDWSSLPSRRKI